MLGFMEGHDGMRWCKYCSCRKDAQHFKKVFTKVSRRLVGYKCDECVAAGKLTVEERDSRAARLKIQMADAHSARNAFLQEIIAENRIIKLREG